MGTDIRFVLPSLLTLAFLFLGDYVGARDPGIDDQLSALRLEVARLNARVPAMVGTSGPSAAAAARAAEDRDALVADIKQALHDEMGLLPLNLLRSRRESFVALLSYGDDGSSKYGTAGYLGNGYFITVKHAVMTMAQAPAAEPRKIVSIQLSVRGRMRPVTLVDSGNARAEVEAGDWAILRAKQPVDLPALSVDLDYDFGFANPIFRLGNDYSKGIIVSTGYIGEKTSNRLVTCLIDGHPGVSGGGVLNQKGELVGIPIGRMQDDYRFSFILPLRAEMLRKVPHLRADDGAVATGGDQR